MFDEILEYMQHLMNFGELEKPKMPDFDVSAYTDSEYLSAIENVNRDYENVDDLDATINYLKGH